MNQPPNYYLQQQWLLVSSKIGKVTGSLTLVPEPSSSSTGPPMAEGVMSLASSLLCTSE